jgi:hypothetical protein
MLAKEMGSVKLILESDCAGAMSKLRSGELDRSAQGPLVEDIKARLGEFEDVLITHVRRSCNEVAHRLAKAGCRNKISESWVGTPPSFVMNALALEAGE